MSFQNSILDLDDRTYLKNYERPVYSISDVYLSLDLNEEKTVVFCKMAFQRLSDDNTESPRADKIILNGEMLKLISLKMNGREMSRNEYKTTDQTLEIECDHGDFTLETVVEINPKQNKSCAGLYLSEGVFTTHCEAENFRKITYFMDRPDVMSMYTVEIRADKKNSQCFYRMVNCNSQRIFRMGDIVQFGKIPSRSPAIYLPLSQEIWVFLKIILKQLREKIFDLKYMRHMKA